MRPYRIRIVATSLLVALLTVVAYWEVGKNDFVTFDDPEYITENPYIRGGLAWPNIRWAFTSWSFHHWHPLTWLSHIVDYRLYGAEPRGHHFTNLALHVANSLLLLLVLNRMTRSLAPSAMVALLFALHPLHVESVAWASERKDVLSSFFWMLSLGAYARYAAQPKLSRYLVVLLTFGLGLMAKPLVVTLPFVLLLLDYWPLRRFATDGRIPGLLCRFRHPAVALSVEKIPLLALSMTIGAVTWLVQGRFGTLELNWLPLHLKIGNALVAYISYIGQMVWPANLSVFYPHPRENLSWPLAAAAGLVLVAISVLALRVRRRLPYVPVGWFWYLGTLVPMIGIIQVGLQAMADHYTYLPLIGLFIVAVWGARDLTSRWRYQRAVLAVSAVGVLVPLILCTRAQVLTWRNSETLYRHAIAVTENNAWAHANLGYYFWTKGALDEAQWHLSQAVHLDPEYPVAHVNLGIVLMARGELEKAADHFREGLRFDPKFTRAAINLAWIYGLSPDLEFRDPELALQYARKACEMTDYSDTLSLKVLAIICRENGQLEESLRAAARARELSRTPSDPSWSDGGLNLFSSPLR